MLEHCSRVFALNGESDQQKNYMHALSTSSRSNEVKENLHVPIDSVIPFPFLFFLFFQFECLSKKKRTNAENLVYPLVL